MLPERGHPTNQQLLFKSSRAFLSVVWSRRNLISSAWANIIISFTLSSLLAFLPLQVVEWKKKKKRFLVFTSRSVIAALGNLLLADTCSRRVVLVKRCIYHCIPPLICPKSLKALQVPVMSSSRATFSLFPPWTKVVWRQGKGNKSNFLD